METKHTSDNKFCYAQMQMELFIGQNKTITNKN